MKFANENLLSLICVLFFFFGGMGCLMPFLPLHMLEVGLTRDQARIISIIAPCVALIGPLIVGPLADRLAGGSGGNAHTKNGRYLRVMIAVTLILAGIFYFLLNAIPTVVILKARRPLVSFSCDPDRGMLLQERCMAEKTCYHWDEEKRGSLFLSNCRYACQAPPQANYLNATDDLTTGYPYEEPSPSTEYDEEDYEEPLLEAPADRVDNRRKRELSQLDLEPPHLCYTDPINGSICQVYTGNAKKLEIKVSLVKSPSEEDEEDWCRYSIGGSFSCRIDQTIVESLTESVVNKSCHPVIQCEVDDPYDTANSLLAESQCLKIIGNPDVTFWTYLIVRSIADIFPTAAIVLLDAAVIIATRETSSGRSDVGRQLAVGSLGLALFAPLVGLLIELITNEGSSIPYNASFDIFAVLMLIGALIVIFAKGMPLSPPEWWWHTRCGMLALPMSAVRKYGMETGALVAVVLLLGIFWSCLDSYLPWYLNDLSKSPFLIGLTVTIGTLPAVPFMWNAEKILDYCGHANILITAFTIYIIRFTILSFVTSTAWIIVFEALEIFTLALMWITAVLYMRHLIPRRFTVTGQALPVIAHFCLGRCIGAIIGGVVPTEYSVESFQYLYRCMALAAAFVAIIYFTLYHCYIKPRCAAPITGPPRPPPTIVQGMNGNGSYTPLRVYHNGRDKKGQFRY